MIFEVSKTTQSINFMPDTVEEIVQNVRTILSTEKGSVPLDRDFGIDMGFLDLPVSSALPHILAGVAHAVHKYEKRVEIQDVTLKKDVSERLIPVVKIKIKGLDNANFVSSAKS